MPVTETLPLEAFNQFDVPDVAERLKASANACDRRKGRDLALLLDLERGPWAARAVLAGATAAPGRALAVAVRLTARGLVWCDGPQPREQWMLVLVLPPNYPLAQPHLQFIGDVPYNPHVTHRDFMPDERGLPAELRQFLAAMRRGHDGGVCLVRSTQWSAAITHDLPLAVWQTSRVLVGAAFYGEAGALNTQARDYYLRLRQEQRLPLGPALPYPDVPGRVMPIGAAPVPDADFAEDDPDVAWQDDHASTNARR